MCSIPDKIKITKCCHGILDTNLVSLSSLPCTTLHGALKVLLHCPPPPSSHDRSICSLSSPDVGSERAGAGPGRSVDVREEHKVVLPISNPYVSILQLSSSLHQQKQSLWVWGGSCNLTPHINMWLWISGTSILSPATIFQVLLCAAAAL